MRRNFDRRAFMRAEPSGRNSNSVLGCHGCFKDDGVRSLVMDADSRRLIWRIDSDPLQINGKLTSLVQHHHIPANMGDMCTGFIVEIDGRVEHPVFGLEDELLLSMDLDHPIGIAKSVGADQEFYSRFVLPGKRTIRAGSRL